MPYAARKPGAEKERPQMDRRLKIRMQGVTPTDEDVANFLYGLTGKPFFDQVAVTYIREKFDSGHKFREFELTFSMQLSTPAGN